MKTITKYLCDICNREYSKESEALRCENLGTPQETANIKEGDEINFWRRHKQNELGSFETYYEDKGTVLHKFSTFNAKDNNHIDIMVCACVDPEMGAVERQVVMIDIEKEGRKLFSPYEWTFKAGWAAGLKKLKS